MPVQEAPSHSLNHLRRLGVGAAAAGRRRQERRDGPICEVVARRQHRHLVPSTAATAAAVASVAAGAFRSGSVGSVA